MTPISIRNTIYNFNTLHVEAIAHKYYKIPFNDASPDKKRTIKDYIRNLVKDEKKISAQIIEDKIFLDLLPKNLQKELNSLLYLQE